MLCNVSKWVRVVYLLKFVMMCVGVFYLRSVSCAQWCVILVSGVRVVYIRSVSCAQWCVMFVSGSVLLIFLSFLMMCVGVVYLRCVSCAQCCVMLVSGSVFFIFVLCHVHTGVLC